MVPAALRSKSALASLNTLGVGLAMAAATAASFSTMFGGGNGAIAVASGVPTLVLGALWARLLRWPRTISPGSSLRVGWLLSAPLAALNAGLAAGLLIVGEERGEPLRRFFGGALLGVTFGIMFWLPALLATLVVFGLPIAWSQRLAARGLAGAERGEGIVAAVSGATSGVAATVLFVDPSGRHLAPAPYLFTLALAALGVLVSGAAGLLALLRARGRERFVKDVEAGKVSGFRLEDTTEGRVLYRVVTQGANYRVADYAEEVATLDREGAVTRLGARGES